MRAPLYLSSILMGHKYRISDGLSYQGREVKKTLRPDRRLECFPLSLDLASRRAAAKRKILRMKNVANEKCSSVTGSRKRRIT